MEGNNTYIIKAQEFIDKAKKIQKSSFLGKLMTYKQDRNDQAKDLYIQAANCLKLAQDFRGAVKCYEAAILCEESESDAKEHFREAGNCLKEHDTDQYIYFMRKAIDLYALDSRPGTGANIAKDCASKLEEEYDFEGAIGFYQKAAQLYQLDNSSKSTECLLKTCELQIRCKQYEKIPECIKVYEKIGKKYLQQPMLKSSAADHFFNSCLCYLANNDTVGAKKQMQLYSIEDSHFEGSMETDLIKKLLLAIEDNNSDDFTAALQEYNQIKPFNKLRTELMLKIQDTHMPQPDFSAAAANEPKEIDFTGADEDNQPNGQNNDENEIDFT